MSKIKKILFAIVLSAAMLFISCASTENSDGQDKSKEPDTHSDNSSVESQIFAKNIKYDSFTPADGIKLPVNGVEIKEFIQFEKSAYILGENSVYKLNIETGESEKLFNTSAGLMACRDGKIYTYTDEASLLEVYDDTGKKTEEVTLVNEESAGTCGLYVTDNYYVLKHYINNSMLCRLNVFSKETHENTGHKDISQNYLWYCDYKNDEFFIINENSFGSYALNIFNAKKADIKKKADLNGVSSTKAADFCYNPKSDTIIAYYCGNYLGYTDITEVREISIKDNESIVHKRFYLDAPMEDDEKLFIGIYENIVSAVSTIQDGYNHFDYLNPPEYITVAGWTPEVDYNFEKEYGIMIRNVNIDYERMALKLMAGDADFDLYKCNRENADYIKAGIYIDLNQYEGLKTRLSGNTAAGFMTEYNGQYFGVPLNIDNLYSKKYYSENSGLMSYSLNITFALYRAQNIDLSLGTYKDPDGKEFYKVLKFVYDNPNGNEDEMPYGKEMKNLDSTILMMNPYSEKKDTSVKYLEYVFDAYSGKIPGIVPKEAQYPELESTEGYYQEWKFDSMKYVKPLFEAYNKVLQTDGKSSTLKQLAKEAAGEVAMRIGE